MMMIDDDDDDDDDNDDDDDVDDDDDDDLWQTVQPGPFSEKQTQWLTLQLCLVTFGVTEWIECSRLNHLF